LFKNGGRGIISETLKIAEKTMLFLGTPMHRKLISTRGMSRAMAKKYGRADTESKR